MKQLYYLLLVLVLPMFVSAQQHQQHVCGTIPTKEMINRLKANKAASQNAPAKSGVITYVPVKIHLVADNNGNGRLERHKAMDALCGVNADYFDQDIQFYLEGDMNEINNSVIYSHSSETGAAVQMDIRKVSNAINIFVGQSAGGNGSGITLGYYSPSRDFIYMTKGVMNSTNNSLTHELGHFFSLNHTFYGWEATDYHANYSAASPPPNFISYAGQSIGVEKVDGTNCNNAADLFCDTPPDFNLGFGWQGCDYQGGAVDPNGQVVDPDETNFMSYFNANTCINSFSTDQKGAILADLNSPQRNYITNNTATNTATVASAAMLTQPPNNTTTQNYDYVTLRWDAVPNADKYLVQLSAFATFAIVDTEVEVTDNKFIIQSLIQNKKYYWRVYAFNESSFCAGFSSTSSFTTGTSPVNTVEIEQVDGISIRPNVIVNGQSAFLNVEASERFEANVSIYNVMGQAVENLGNQVFNSGVTNMPLTTSNLESGVYIVSIQTESGRLMSKKLLVTK